MNAAIKVPIMQDVFDSNQLDKLTPIPLKGLDSVKLLNRVDRKYIIHIRELSEIIDLLYQENYAILEIDGCRAFTYLTTYFDTEDYRFFMDHHNRRSNRLKARTRTYKENDLHFFEIKSKTNLRTNKVRERLMTFSNDLLDFQEAKIRELYPKQLESRLAPTLYNSFTRITLVNSGKTERCTIDVNIAFENPNNPGEKIPLKDIVVIEVKQSKTSILHGIVAALRTKQIRPSGISKYILGLILTQPETKYNYFKPLLLKLDKLQSIKY